jgi:hypothetical protein
MLRLYSPSFYVARSLERLKLVSYITSQAGVGSMIPTHTTATEASRSFMKRRWFAASF